MAKEAKGHCRDPGLLQRVARRLNPLRLSQSAIDERINLTPAPRKCL